MSERGKEEVDKGREVVRLGREKKMVISSSRMTGFGGKREGGK